MDVQVQIESVAMIKHERPDFILNFVKPKNTEIKHINGHWYLYGRATRYNPETGKSTKVSGTLLGSITEGGFVEKRVKLSPGKAIEVVELVASQYFIQKGARIREKLKLFFPDLWREMFCLAIMALVHDRDVARCEIHYETSILCALFPHLDLSFASLEILFDRIEKDGENIRAFMLALSSDQVYSTNGQQEAPDHLSKGFACDATLLLNHLSMMMGLEATALLDKRGDISLEDFIQGMRAIQAAKVDGAWHRCRIPKMVKAMCTTLGLELEPLDELFLRQER
ncbi:MAG: hypothetical protein RBR15_12640 [Sphaerochaeta sp.]|nr:hypothetical protein [Sphaerochaeta sp.]